MNSYKATYLTLLILIYLLGLFGLLIDVVNPHSFLSSTGAILRVALLIVGTVAWIAFSRYIKKRILNAGTVFLVTMIFVYLYAAATLFNE